MRLKYELTQRIKTRRPPKRDRRNQSPQPARGSRQSLGNQLEPQTTDFGANIHRGCHIFSRHKFEQSIRKRNRPNHRIFSFHTQRFILQKSLAKIQSAKALAVLVQW